jgi:membrane protease YdiL (CAAX protease family)
MWALIPIATLYLGRWGLFFWVFPPLANTAPWQRILWVTLIRFLLIALALWLERGHWADFFITRRNGRVAVRDGLWIGLAFLPIGWLYARLTLGGVYWLPVHEWLTTFLAAFILAGLQEELEYRAFLLGVTQRWNIPPVWAIVVIGLLFGPVHHNRYLWRGDFLTLGIVTAFGFLATWLTLKRSNVAGAIIGHTAMNFLIFLFIGGKVRTL